MNLTQMNMFNMLFVLNNYKLIIFHIDLKDQINKHVIYYPITSVIRLVIILYLNL